MYDYEWNPAKVHVNQMKHGVSFAEATTALEDERALTIEDNYPDEQRFITLGRDALDKVLVVVYTFRSSAIRIISARKATARERKQYEEG